MRRHARWLVLLACVELACGAAPRRPPSPPASFHATVVHDDGRPAAGAVVAITHVATRKQVAVTRSDERGRFAVALAPGAHAFAITAPLAYGWFESELAPSAGKALSLSRACHVVSGRASNAAGAQVQLVRMSRSTGDTFVTTVGADGRFSACLPAAHYATQLAGSAISLTADVALPGTRSVTLTGLSQDGVKQPPRAVAHATSSLDAIVADVLARDARMIGLGEATHGTAELVTARTELTLELVRRADVRLVLFEGDAVLGAALDHYVTGGAVDLGAAVAALGFWTSDTVEFLAFLRALRAYNATAVDPVRVWGVDLQNPAPPAAVLREAAVRRQLTDADRAMLDLLERDDAAVETVGAARRAAFEATLRRLATGHSDTFEDLRIAVAARSLLVQLSYLDGDQVGLYGARRDRGMARMASFLLEQTGARRAVFWAHAAHVAREPSAGQRSTGDELAARFGSRYYPVGFYLEQGGVRAWDTAIAIGVIPHAIPRAAFSVESAIIQATRGPAIAWLPLAASPPGLRAWLQTPRFVREVGWLFVEEDTLMLRDMLAAFDAVVVVRDAHASTPTPTGVRTAAPD